LDELELRRIALASAAEKMLRVEAEEELGSLSSQALNSVPKTDETNTTKSSSVAKNVKLRDSKLPGEHFVPVFILLPFEKNRGKLHYLV